MKLGDASNAVTPDQFEAILKEISLRGVFLEDLQVNLRRDVLSDTGPITLEHSLGEWDVILTDPALPELEVQLAVIGKVGRRSCFKLAAVYRLRYESHVPVSEAFMVILANTSAVVQIWPFFRELVSSVTSRMELPHLTLPLLKPTARP